MKYHKVDLQGLEVDLPILPLYHSERTYLRSHRHVNGWQPRLLDNFPLDAVEVKP